MRTVIDEITGRRLQKTSSVLIITDVIDGIYIFGYTSRTNSTKHCIPIKVFLPDYGEKELPALKKNLENKMIYSNYSGKWIFKDSCSRKDLISHKYLLGHGANRGKFIYSFQRNYEAIQNFDIFKGKQVIVENKFHPLSKHLPYTIGLEYETSQGYLPENICFRDGLIPLRDGSITGLEYSSVVMEGNDGLCLLEQQIKSLRKWTTFNKECSLHIHFGNFPRKEWAVWNLYNICYRLQDELSYILPPATFRTSTYKNSGKDYCKLLPTFTSFENLYENLVGLRWVGSFTEPHPNDPRRDRKWNIPTRYYFVNFINFLCYNVNKTIEFRFLRPTYNIRRIKSWIYLFSAILQCAEKLGNNDNIRYPSSFSEIFKIVYPKDKEMREFLEDEVLRQQILTKNQTFNGDNIGADVMLENLIYDEDELI